jgi:hypothetical protein
MMERAEILNAMFELKHFGMKSAFERRPGQARPAREFWPKIIYPHASVAGSPYLAGSKWLHCSKKDA